MWADWPERLVGRPASVQRWVEPARSMPPAPQWQPEGSVVETRDAWCRRVAAAEVACRTTALRKVVLARATRFDGAFCPVATARALRASQPGATVFFVSRGDAVFLGASPETLLRVDGGRLTTHALAGTRRRGADAVEDAALASDLLCAIKDRREHALVVADLAERLAPFCVTLDWAHAPRIRKLATVQHLETPFWGALRADVDPAEVAAALHPTAALGGAPRPAAAAWLRRTEPLDRGFYGAPIGWSDGVNAHFVVAIRSGLITPSAAYTFGGAGIVAGSDPAAEWDETALKQAVVAAALRPVA